MKKWQWKSSAVLLTGALTFGTPVSALAEVENRAAAESMSKEESHEEKNRGGIGSKRDRF